MSLPILNTSQAPTDEALVRLYLKTELHWTQHLSEEVQLDVGTAFANAQLDRVADANRVMDAALSKDVSPADAVREVDEHFAANSARCLMWTMNPSATIEQRQPLIDHLLSIGYRQKSVDILYLDRMPTATIVEIAGLKIIPARASFRHARQLAEESAQGDAQHADAAMAHLDDPHLDAILALRDGVAVAAGGVLAVGEIGRIDDVFVSEKFRRQGIGRTIMSRLLEICARAQFRHILLNCDQGNEPAQEMYRKIGFRKISQLIVYQRPATSS